MAHSQAVVLYNDTPPKSIVPFVGPGRLVHKFNTYVGGKVADGCSKLVIRFGHDPSALASRIEGFFRVGSDSSLEKRQTQLDFLYDLLYNGSIETPSQVTHLKKDCLKLLNSAWPQSSSETTQWAVFDFLIQLITRYPGLRRIFCQNPRLPIPFNYDQISKDWQREGHTFGPEFDLFREFASFCLHQSKVVEIVERERPSDLARIEWVAASADDEPCLNYVPIEELLLHCRDGPEFTFERLSAIRYLAAILQLPAVWVHDKNRLTGILSNVCNTICMLIEDTDSDDPSAEGKNVWIRLALDSIDNAARALLKGIKDNMLRLPSLKSLLAELCRPDVMTRFPLSSPIALEIKSLQSDSVQNVNSHVTQAFEQASFPTGTDDMGAEVSMNQNMQSEDIDPSREEAVVQDLMQDEPSGGIPLEYMGVKGRSERFFALIIGIDKYKSDKLMDLRGCVNDARAMRLFLSSLQVPESNVVTLIDADATREAILSSFDKHLINNAQIEKGDPIIIFYAGHGSLVEAPAEWETSDGKIGMISPHDQSMQNEGDGEIPGIPSTTIDPFLRKLAEKKGNNVTAIFDCVHSASMTSSISKSGEDLFPKGLAIPNLTNASGPDQRLDSTTFVYDSMSSHVLLAACGRDELAYETKNNKDETCGAFTNALITTLYSVPLDRTTYKDLMTCLPSLPRGQIPQCRGINMERTLFSCASPPPIPPGHSEDHRNFSVERTSTEHLLEFVPPGLT